MTPIGRYFDERKVKLAFYALEGASPRVEPHLNNSGTVVRPVSSSNGARGSATAEHARDTLKH
jgi:hypothetical protein